MDINSIVTSTQTSAAATLGCNTLNVSKIVQVHNTEMKLSWTQLFATRRKWNTKRKRRRMKWWGKNKQKMLKRIVRGTLHICCMQLSVFSVQTARRRQQQFSSVLSFIYANHTQKDGSVNLIISSPRLADMKHAIFFILFSSLWFTCSFFVWIFVGSGVALSSFGSYPCVIGLFIRIYILFIHIWIQINEIFIRITS